LVALGPVLIRRGHNGRFGRLPSDGGVRRVSRASWARSPNRP
jgi:hypothetical protein